LGEATVATRKKPREADAAADETKNTPAEETIAAQVRSPPVFPATEMAVSILPVGVFITFGQLRILIDENGQPHGPRAKEWHFTLSVSPQTLKQYVHALTQALVTYEGHFGEIKVNTDIEQDEISR
jgi:hypothetical protein